MRLLVATLLVTAASCSEHGSSMPGQQGSSDPGVDGGAQTDGGSSTTAEDARVPPPFDAGPDGPPANLTPCQEAVFHSDFAWIQTKIFAVSCTSGSCHDIETPQAKLDLTGGHAYAELVNVKSTIYTSSYLVTPGDPAASMLMVRLGGADGPVVDTMPKGQAPLCSEKIEAVRRWIAAGAAND
jgi:hypothetical protein